jgi:hypothetical protein
MDPQRLWRVALACSAFLAPVASADPAAPGVRLLVQSSALAGFRHHAAADVWLDLRIGDPLLARRPTTRTTRMP